MKASELERRRSVFSIIFVIILSDAEMYSADPSAGEEAYGRSDEYIIVIVTECRRPFLLLCKAVLEQPPRRKLRCGRYSCRHVVRCKIGPCDIDGSCMREVRCVFSEVVEGKRRYVCEVPNCAQVKSRVRRATSNVGLTFVIYLVRDLAEFPACKTQGWKISKMRMRCARCLVS